VSSRTKSSHSIGSSSIQNIITRLGIYLEELVLSTVEAGALSIVHEDCGIVDHWHLSEALLGVEQYIEDGDDTHGDEATDDNVVLSHRVVLLP